VTGIWGLKVDGLGDLSRHTDVVDLSDGQETLLKVSLYPHHTQTKYWIILHNGQSLL
jgi:hypothetical protein